MAMRYVRTGSEDCWQAQAYRRYSQTYLKLQANDVAQHDGEQPREVHTAQDRLFLMSYQLLKQKPLLWKHNSRLISNSLKVSLIVRLDTAR